MASVRLRTLRPITYLRRRGWQAGLLEDVTAPDVVIFQKAYAPEHLELARTLKRRGVRIVADFCDNHLWRAERSTQSAARALCMQQMADLADAIVVPTPTLASALGRQAMIVADAVELPPGGLFRAAHVARRLVGDVPLRLLWFGASASSAGSGGMRDLEALLPLLGEAASHRRLHLTVMSNDRRAYARSIRGGPVPSAYVGWRRGALPVLAARFHIALLPVQLDPFTACKSSNRPATALLHGLACIADRVPSYSALGRGVWTDGWLEGLHRYSERHAREADVHVGRALALELYDEAVVAAQWSEVIEHVLAGGT